MITYRKVGGMRFLRVFRLQVSWCVVSSKPKLSAEAKRERRAAQRQSMKAAKRAAYVSGWQAAHECLTPLNGE